MNSQLLHKALSLQTERDLDGTDLEGRLPDVHVCPDRGRGPDGRKDTGLRVKGFRS